MAQLRNFRVTVQDSAGNAVSGAAVEVRKQGAFVISQSSDTVIAVNDPGGIGVGDTVAINTGTTTRSVSAVAATQITVGAPGFPGLSDDDRMTAVTPLPLIYNDAQGAETASNPLTTGADGTVSWWMAVPCDVHVSAASITTKLYSDYSSIGENFTSNVFDSATAVAWELDTSRALSTAGAKLLSVRNQNTEKASIDKDGDVACSDLTVSGNATVAGTLGITGATTASSITASSDINQRRIRATQGTAVVTGDFALSAGWGDAATKAVLTGSTDTRGRLRIQANGAGIAANPSVTLTFKDGAYAAAPFTVASRGDAVAPAGGYWSADAPTTTTVAYFFIGLPVANNIYDLWYMVIG